MEEKPDRSPELAGSVREEAVVHCSESHDAGAYLNKLNSLLETNTGNELLARNVEILEIHCRTEKAPEDSNLLEAINKFMTLLGQDDSSADLELYNSNPVLLYNLAVLFFHYNQYSRVEELLSKLMLNPTLSDVNVKVRILRIDAFIKSKQFGRALSAIEDMEGFRAQSETEINNPSPRTVSPNIIVSKADFEEFDANLKTRLQLYKTLCCLSTRSFKLAKRECKLLFGLLGTSSHSHVGGMSLKAYQEYLRGNTTKAINFIKSIPPNVLKKSNKVLENTGELITAIVSNNEACCHFYMGRPLWSAFLFKKAIMAFDIKTPDTLPIFAVNFKKYQVECLYNFGVACLHAKDTDRAFQCLLGCTRHFGTNPRLWLRLAECCIQKHKQTNEYDMKWTEEKKNLLKAIKGAQQDSPKLLFSDKFSSSESEIPGTSERNEIAPTLYYGSHCIATALALMKPTRTENSVCLQVPPSNPLVSERAISSLHASILAAGAYLSLSIKDYATAIKRARDLINLPNLPGALQYLGKQYLSQALLLYGDMAEAIRIAEEEEEPIDLTYCVSPFDGHSEDRRDESVDSAWSGCSSSMGDGNGARKPLQVWYPRDEATAKMLTVYNRACILALAGKLDKADEVLRHWLTQATGSLLPPEFLMLAVYLHIQRGNISKAISLLKEHSPTAFIT